jgi:hypothetical protein
MGPGDHHCHAGQEKICLEKVRDKYDEVFVTEKLDGTSVAVGRVSGELIPLIRSGYRAVSSKYEQHVLFHIWAMKNLEEGSTANGEWLALAHGTRYDLPHDPFVMFDVIKMQNVSRRGNSGETITEETPEPYRITHDEMLLIADNHGLVCPRTMHIGGSVPLSEILTKIRKSEHGAIDPVEGAVWRVQRAGTFDFMAKYVRPDKKDGCLLPEVTGAGPVWNTVNGVPVPDYIKG